MNRYALFRKSTLVASLPLLLLMSTPACGDQGGQQSADNTRHDTAPTEEAATPSSISGIWTQITAKRDAIASLLQSNQLKGIHHESEALETLGEELVKSSTMLDEGKLARVRGAVNQMRQVAGDLHHAADKGDAAGAKVEFQKLEALLTLIEAQYPAGTLSSGAQGKPSVPNLAEGSMGKHHAHNHSMGEERGELVPPNAQRFMIHANDFSFTPKEIAARAGQPLAITLMNRGKSEHDWVIAARPEVHVHVPPGKSETRVFNLDVPGEYKVVCTIPGHEQLGMVGKVVVR